MRRAATARTPGSLSRKGKHRGERVHSETRHQTGSKLVHDTFKKMDSLERVGESAESIPERILRERGEEYRQDLETLNETPSRQENLSLLGEPSQQIAIIPTTKVAKKIKLHKMDLMLHGAATYIGKVLAPVHKAYKKLPLIQSLINLFTLKPIRMRIPKKPVINRGQVKDIQDASRQLPFSITKRGELEYLVDHSGREISKGFQNIKLHEFDIGNRRVSLLTAQSGKMKHLLKVSSANPLKVISVRKNRLGEFTDLHYREDLGAFVIKADDCIVGVGKRLPNGGYTSNPATLVSRLFLYDISTGYRLHRAGYDSIQNRGGQLYGTRGDVTEPIEWSPSANRNRQPVEIPAARLLSA